MEYHHTIGSANFNGHDLIWRDAPTDVVAFERIRFGTDDVYCVAVLYKTTDIALVDVFENTKWHDARAVHQCFLQGRWPELTHHLTGYFGQL